MIQLCVEGNPTPWAAHGGYGKRAYNKKSKEKAQAIWQLKPQFPLVAPINGPVCLEITYFMPVPKGTPKRMRSQMLNGVVHHLKRPDLDNLNKFICDVMKNLIFWDDSQIVKIFSRKIYGECPKTLIKVLDESTGSRVLS